MICHVSLEAVYTHTSNCLENKEKVNIKKRNKKDSDKT